MGREDKGYHTIRDGGDNLRAESEMGKGRPEPSLFSPAGTSLTIYEEPLLQSCGHLTQLCPSLPTTPEGVHSGSICPCACAGL